MKLWDKIKKWFKCDSEYLVTVQEVKTADIEAAIEADEKRRGELGRSYADIPQRIYIQPNVPKDNLIPYYERILTKMSELRVENPLIESRGLEVYIDNADKVLFATSKEAIVKYDVIEISHGGSGKKEFVCELTVKFPRIFQDTKTYCACTMKVEIILEGFFTGMSGSGERIGAIRTEMFEIALDILRHSSITDNDGFTVAIPKDVHNKKIDELKWKTSLPLTVSDYTYTNRNPQLDVLTGRESTSNKFYLTDLLRIKRLRHKKNDSNFKYEK